jgi:hypothetical protein
MTFGLKRQVIDVLYLSVLNFYMVLNKWQWEQVWVHNSPRTMTN